MKIKPIMKSAAASEEKESAALNSVMFYPAERVHEIFARLEATQGKPDEMAELRIFAERMKWLYENQSLDAIYWPETEDLIRWAAYGEAVEDAIRTEKMERNL